MTLQVLLVSSIGATSIFSASSVVCCRCRGRCFKKPSVIFLFLNGRWTSTFTVICDTNYRVCLAGAINTGPDHIYVLGVS